MPSWQKEVLHEGGTVLWERACPRLKITIYKEIGNKIAGNRGQARSHKHTPL